MERNQRRLAAEKALRERNQRRLAAEEARKRIPMETKLASNALATIPFHPINTIKVRMQIGVGSSILQNQGLGGLYKGLSAGLLASVSNTAFEAHYSSRSLTRSLFGDKERQGISLLSVAVVETFFLNPVNMAAIVVNPFELAATRMQGDAALHPHLRRNYKNVFHAIYRAAADEGLLALWRGSCPSMFAAWGKGFGLGAGFMVSKTLDRNPNLTNVIGTCFVACVAPAALSQPFDYVKTQMQMMQPDKTGKYPYISSMDCVRKTLKLGGLRKFYTGFTAHCLATLPQYLLASLLTTRVLAGMKVTTKM